MFLKGKETALCWREGNSANHMPQDDTRKRNQATLSPKGELNPHQHLNNCNARTHLRCSGAHNSISSILKNLFDDKKKAGQH